MLLFNVRQRLADAARARGDVPQTLAALESGNKVVLDAAVITSVLGELDPADAPYWLLDEDDSLIPGYKRRTTVTVPQLDADEGELDPARFGWRVWFCQDGRLVTPCRLVSPSGLGAPSDSPLIKARCDVHDEPPVPECECGIYYVPADQWESFWAGLQFNLLDQGMNREIACIAYGYASGAVLHDPDPARWQAVRADSFEVYGLLTAKRAPWAKRLADQLDVELVKGIDWDDAELTRKAADRLLDKIYP